MKESVSCSIMFGSLQPNKLKPTRLLCPWDSVGKNTGVGCHSLLQEIFLTHGLNAGLLHCTWNLYCLSCQRSPSFACACVCVCVLGTQVCLMLCDPMYYIFNVKSRNRLATHFFLALHKSPLFSCITIYSSISSAEGHLGCFQIFGSCE